jgi:diguanylate cyclase (GGDEF)-like protein
MQPASRDTLIPIATHTLPWFALLAAAVGAAPFAVASDTLLQPRLAVVALGSLLLELLLTRLLPYFRQRNGLRVLLDILALLLFAFLVCAATSGIDSYLLTLFLLPLTAAAILLSRFGFLLTIGVVTLSYAVLGALTPHVDLWSSAFVIHMIGGLVPTLIATSAISLLMGQMQVVDQQIRDMSATDALTGLMNLRAFEQLLEQNHGNAERSGRAYSLAVIDLDNLAQINAAHGHDAANQMLLAVADAVKRSIRHADTAARLGGNELAILLQDADATVAGTVTQRIRNSVSAGTISVANRMLRANVSIGVTSFPTDQLTSRQLLNQAMLLMEKDRALRKPVDKA